MPKPPAFILLLVYLCTCLESVNSLEKCTKITACSCQSDKGVIDLSPLTVTGTPKLQAKHEKEIFYYNPCQNFDIGTVKNAGVVQYQSQYDLYYATGSNKDVSMSIADGHLEITLAGTEKKKTVITVLCGTSLEFTFTKENPVNEYHLNLKAQEGCPGYVPSSNGSSGLSVGSIVLIVFVVLVICYIGFGVAFQLFIKKKSGKEAIPNSTFWTIVPGLIKVRHFFPPDNTALLAYLTISPAFGWSFTDGFNRKMVHYLHLHVAEGPPSTHRFDLIQETR